MSLGLEPCLPVSPTDSQWMDLYEIAKKQSLIGVCFAGVQRLQKQYQSPPEILYLQWMGMAAKIQQRNRRMNKHCAELISRLEKEGFKACILKGQGVGALYAHHLADLRQPGDIDVLASGGFEKVFHYAKSISNEANFGYLNTHLNVFDDTEVELHWRPCNLPNVFANNRLQRWIADNESEIYNSKYVLPGYVTIITPSVRFNRIFILLHAYKHMFDEGLGMRHLMDLYFVYMAELPSVPDRKEFKELTKDFGVAKFTRAIMWILNEVFRMPSSYIMIEPDEKYGRIILDKVIAGGNFGHYESAVKKLSRNIHIQALLTRVQHNWDMLMAFPSEFLWSPLWLAYHFFRKRFIKK